MKDIAQTNKKERKPEKNKGNEKEGAGKIKMVQIASWSIGMFLHSLSLFLLERRGKCGAREKGNGRETYESCDAKTPAVKRGRAKKKNEEDC